MSNKAKTKLKHTKNKIQNSLFNSILYAAHVSMEKHSTEILNAKKDSLGFHNVFQMQNCCHLSVSNFHRKGLTVTFIF